MIKQLYLGIRAIAFLPISIATSWMRWKKLAPEKIKRILLVADFRIGDTVLASSAIAVLKKRYPSASISVLVNSSAQAVWQMNPAVALVIPFDSKWSYFKKVLLAIHCAGRPFDLAIDMMCDYPILTALMAWCSGARFRIGYGNNSRGFLFNTIITRRPGVHFTDELLDLAYAAYADHASSALSSMSVSQSAQETAQSLLKSKGIHSEKILGMHAGGTYATQRWLPERFAAVGDSIQDRYGATVLLFGSGAQERALNESIAGLMKKKPVIISDKPLDVVGAIIQQTKLMVCNNSGLLHLTAAMGVPTVSFMGPTIAYRWSPVGIGHIVLRKNIPCIGCNSGICRIKTHDCMNLITVDEVVEAINIIISR